METVILVKASQASEDAVPVGLRADATIQDVVRRSLEALADAGLMTPLLPAQPSPSPPPPPPPALRLFRCSVSTGMTPVTDMRGIHPDNTYVLQYSRIEKVKHTNIPILPKEVIVTGILPFLDMDEDIPNLRIVSKPMRKLCNMDKRLMPVVAPPEFSEETLSLEEHGPRLWELYQENKAWYNRWKRLYGTENYDALEQMSTPMDGYFSLAPFRKDGEDSDFLAPLLDRILHGPEGYFRPLLRSTIPEGGVCRLTVPLNPNTNGPCTRNIYTSLGKWHGKVVIQPKNIMIIESSGIPLPGQVENVTHLWHPVCIEILECYLGDGRVLLNEAQHSERSIQLQPSDFSTTGSLIGFRFEENKAVDAESLAALPNYQENGINGQNNDLVVNVIPQPLSHMQFYSGDACLLSTELIRRIVGENDHGLQIRGYTVLMLCCIAQTVGGIELECANSGCVLNWKNHRLFSARFIRLLPCPSCLRKLHFAGLLRDDFHAVLERLDSIISRDCFGDTFVPERNLLNGWRGRRT